MLAHCSAVPGTGLAIDVSGKVALPGNVYSLASEVRIHRPNYRRCRSSHQGRFEIDAIVSGKARGQYTRAAQLLTCCAEALTLAHGAEAGIALVESWRARYPRHGAFRRELNGAIGKTPLVTAALR